MWHTTFKPDCCRFQQQTDLQKASVNASRADNEVEQEMETFEQMKLKDIKVSRKYDKKKSPLYLV